MSNFDTNPCDNNLNKIKTVDKLQVRSGKLTDLPQPLKTGEFGWAMDTQNLFIGTSCDYVPSGVQITDGNFSYAQTLIDNSTILVELTSSYTKTNYAAFRSNIMNSYPSITDTFIRYDGGTQILIGLPSGFTDTAGLITLLESQIDVVTPVTIGSGYTVNVSDGTIPSLNDVESGMLSHILNNVADDFIAQNLLNVRVLTSKDFNFNNVASWDEAYSWGDHSLVGYEEQSNKGQPDGYAPLNSSSKIPTTYLPSISLTDVTTVADIPARDALSPQSGDVAIVLDASGDTEVGSGSASYMYDGFAWFRLEAGTTLNDGDLLNNGGTILETGNNISELINDSGYLTTEIDPTVPSHVKNITTTNISNWDTAFGWGDHSTQGYFDASSDVDHDATTNYVANEHIDWTIDQGTTNIDPVNVELAKIGTPTYSNLQHFANLAVSPGRIEGGNITDAGSGTIDVSQGNGWIKATDDNTAQVMFFDWPASTGISIPVGETRFIGIEYNSGSPQVVSRILDNYDLDTEFPLGQVVNEGGDIHILNNPWWTGDPVANILERFQAEGKLLRDESFGGLILGETGTRNITVTSSILWSRLNEFLIPAIDTSGTDTFITAYRDGSGGWTYTSGVTQWPNTQYDDGSGTLQTVNNSSYSNLWFYVETDGDIVMLYGQSENSNLSNIQDEQPPSGIPKRLEETGLLIGRITFQKNGSTAESIDTVFDTSFKAASITQHANLGGLTADDHTQYALANGTRGDFATVAQGNLADTSLQPDDYASAGGDILTTDSGTTANRPGTPVLGQIYFDTDLGQPIWYDGTNWVDATGTTA